MKVLPALLFASFAMGAAAQAAGGTQAQATASGTASQTAPAVPVDQRTWMNPSQTPEQRAHELVQQMTLDEKAQQLEDWATAIPRLGVPDYQTWNEALHGVARAGYATVFPQAIGMAATWDTSAIHTMGDVIAEEARAKYNQAQREDNHRIFFGLTFWSPNINIFRDPRWGRGQETYGEDPFLTGSMGTAFIHGVQGDDPLHPKAMATSKHFAVHSGPESQRHTFDVHPSPRDLEETYLPAFRQTVTEGHVDSVMCAYNAINGFAACDNTMLLKDHLRDAWGFKGFVVSDCAAIVDVTNGHHNAPDIEHAAAASLKAGTDLSCSIWAPGFNTLAKAVRDGLVSEDLVTKAAERLYKARFELGMFDPQGSSPLDRIPMSVVGSEKNREDALRAANESMVLLKNTGVLPLKGVHSIAVLGPTADLLTALEGNYNGEPVDPVTPLDGIITAFPGAQVRYAQGANLAEGFTVPVPRTVFPGGLKTDYFATPDWTGKPVASLTSERVQYDWANARPTPAVHTQDYSVRWSGRLQVPAPGSYTFVITGGESFPYSPRETYRMVLDGKVLGEGDLNSGKLNMGHFSVGSGANPTAPPVMSGAKPAKITVTLNDTEPHTFSLEYSHSGDRAGGGVALSWQPPAEALLNEAVAAAKQSDVAVVFTGLSPQLEGEEMPIHIEGFSGGDRTSIALPESQQKLLEAVAATGKPVIEVNLSGSAIALTWAREHAAALLQAWYPGVAGGTAVAETLAGENNPGGRLPVTFYADTSDLPPFTDYSMKNRTYRYYTGKPLWGFGYGLSYTSFQYGPVKLASPTVQASSLTGEHPMTATVKVTNTGKMDGDEVVEAYLKTPKKDGPVHSLVAFQRVHLAAGQSQVVTLNISGRSVSSVDEQGNRSILPGSYRLSVGSAQPEETQQKSEVEFHVTGTEKLPK